MEVTKSLRVEKCYTREMALYYMTAFFAGAEDEQVVEVSINGQSMLKGWLTNRSPKIPDGVVLMSAKTRKKLGVTVGKPVDVVLRYGPKPCTNCRCECLVQAKNK